MDNVTIGQRVKHECLHFRDDAATVVAAAQPFAGHECVVIEFRAIFSDFGPGYAQRERRHVLARPDRPMTPPPIWPFPTWRGQPFKPAPQPKPAPRPVEEAPF